MVTRRCRAGKSLDNLLQALQITFYCLRLFTIHPGRSVTASEVDNPRRVILVQQHIVQFCVSPYHAFFMQLCLYRLQWERVSGLKLGAEVGPFRFLSGLKFLNGLKSLSGLEVAKRLKEGAVKGGQVPLEA